MSARQIRGQLADARAMEEQSARENMHGGGRYVGAGHFVGAGGVPSMGTSQFRGGGPPIGTSYGAFTGVRSPLVPYRGTRTSTAIVPYRPPTVVRPPLVPFRPGRPTSTTLTVRGPGTMKPYNAAEAKARLDALRAAKPSSTASATKIASRLGQLGVTAAAVAAAIAAGIGMNELVKYFEGLGRGVGQDLTSGTDVYGPGGVMDGDPGTDGPFVPPGGGTEYTEPQPWWSYGQNLTARDVRGSGMCKGCGSGMCEGCGYGRRKGRRKGGRTPLPPKPITSPGGPGRGLYRSPSFYKNMRPVVGQPVVGSGRSDGRSARAAVVRQVMAEHGLGMIQASKFVKEHGLY